MQVAFNFNTAHVNPQKLDFLQKLLLQALPKGGFLSAVVVKGRAGDEINIRLSPWFVIVSFSSGKSELIP
jgi:hypothetical protein